MRLSVHHNTVYAFEAPMRFVTQSHRLTPASSQGQKVASWSIDVKGADFGAAFTDGGGDLVTTMTMEGPVSRIEVVVSGTVETSDTSGVLRGHSETVSPRCFLRETKATKASPAIRALLEACLREVQSEGDLARAHALCDCVAQEIVYRPGTTHAHSTAAEVVEAGEGVCQDHAHVLISLAHLARMPARYVTGYLLVNGEEGAAGEASHAWAEIFVEGLGWVGFDASNATCPDERYVRLGSGRDAIEAAPIRGVSRGGGGEAMDVSVKVAAQQ
ncbi:MAG: transglutaminase family protein [Pseudomonadota bacterium]